MSTPSYKGFFAALIHVIQAFGTLDPWLHAAVVGLEDFLAKPFSNEEAEVTLGSFRITLLE